MGSETRRNLLRIATNYIRLLLNLTLGILLVRLILRGVGTDGFGLIGLLGAATGITAMFQMVVQRSMIRELGKAHHSTDKDEFTGTYNSALVLTWGAALLSCLLFLGMYLVLPWFDIPEHLQWAARWLVVASAGQTVVIIAVGAPMNMYLVEERMVAFNVWRVIERACFVTGAACVAYGFTDIEPGPGIVIYGFISSSLIAATHLTASALIMSQDRRLVPRLRHVNRPHFKAVLGIGGWNAGVVASLNLHHHADNIIMNQAFGLFGNAVFTLSIRLTGYVRMFATGMTTGLDAVTARVSSTDDGNSRLARLLHNATRMHGLATLPAVCAMCLLADPILRLWVGAAVKDPQTTIPAAVMVTWTLGVGIAAHAIADGWITVLYGAGYIRRYAPLIIIGGVLNPIIATVLLFTLPEHMRLIGPALAYSLIMLIIHFILLPITIAKVVEIKLTKVFSPLVPPLIATALASPVLFVATQRVQAWTLPILLAVILAYSLVFAALSFYLVLTPDERRRAINALRKITKRGAEPN